MRVHSDVLTSADFYSATKGLPGVYADVSEHGSRSHTRAFELSLDGNGYRRNSGQYGAGDKIGATWDEWGVVISRLFVIDRNALFGSVKYPAYNGAADFELKTGNRFDSATLPADTHKRHTWDWYMGRATCKKCTAIYLPRI